MGVSVDTGGKGRGKSMGVELNLVPFIDFLSCILAFLMMTAVWAEISAIEQEQLVSNEPAPPVEQEKPPPPPLTVHIRADGYEVFRKIEEMKALPRVDSTDDTLRAEDGKQFDYTKLEEALVEDRKTFPDEKMIVINTDDGVNYEEMIRVLDMSRKHDLPQSLLAGGAPSSNPLGFNPNPPAPPQ
jgi:biopolymer transport protein ExbD